MYIDKIIMEISREYAKNKEKSISFEELFEKVFEDENIQQPRYNKMVNDEIYMQKHLLDIWGDMFEKCYNLYFLCLDSADWVAENRVYLDTDNGEWLDLINAQTIVWNRVVYMFNAIILLCRSGMVDSGYQLCRPLYELGIISELLSLDNISVCNFIDTQGKGIKDYSWALDYINRERAKINYKPLKKATFAEVEKYVTKNKTLYNRRNENYKEICSFIHATPSFLWNTLGVYGTRKEFKRLPIHTDINIEIPLRHAIYYLNIITLNLLRAHIDVLNKDKLQVYATIFLSVSECGDIVINGLEEYGQDIRQEIDKYKDEEGVLK